MPLLGFGVYQNYDTAATTLEAFKAGYRHVDSAQVYRNEAEVGAAVRASGLPRSEVFITTKCVSKTHGYESTKQGVDASLSKMQFGAYRISRIWARRLETYKALLEAKAEGKIRTVGVSNYNVKHLKEIKAKGWELPAVNQIELQPFCQQKPIVDYCKEHNIIIQAYCPIIRGKMDHPVIMEVAAKHNRDPAQILIRWSLQRGFVPLPKSATPSRIHSNAQVYDFELDEEDMKKLDDLDRGKAGGISWNPVDAD
ncbi:NADP-dependent oxidoreductase domain-containing protein [Pholiota molesta]|nr:NADP-dependent oxidoreductase domain-containing protein [Pholiota molesta]